MTRRASRSETGLERGVLRALLPEGGASLGSLAEQAQVLPERALTAPLHGGCRVIRLCPGRWGDFRNAPAIY